MRKLPKGSHLAIVYVSDDIDNDMAKEISTTLFELGQRFMNVPDARILVDINSTGGNVYDAFSIINAMKLCPVPVDTYVSGLAASAAFVVAVAGEVRYCSSLASYMFHSVSATQSGNMSSIQNDMNHTLDLQKRLVSFVQKHSKITKKKLTEIVESSKDWYYTTKEVLRMGVVDCVVDVQ